MRVEIIIIIIVQNTNKCNCNADEQRTIYANINYKNKYQKL